MKGYQTLILLIFFASSSAFAERYEVAVHNYKEKNYPQAFTQFQELAALGNKDAQYSIGIFYLNGFGVPTNHLTAYSWFKLAGSKNDSQALNLANELYKGMSDKQRQKAEAAFQTLASTHSDEIIREKILLESSARFQSADTDPLILRVTQPDYPRAAARRGIHGEVTIEFDLGKDGRSKNHRFVNYTDPVFKQEAMNAVKEILYRPAQLDGKATELIGVQYRFIFQMANSKPDEEATYKQLMDLREKAVQGGSIERYQYAQALGVLKRYLTDDQQKSAGDVNQWYTKAAVDGLPHAQYKLGLAALYGRQCEQDDKKSTFWLETAANDGFTPARTALAVNALSAAELARRKWGMHELKAAAATGEPRAQLEFARALAFPPEGIASDFELAAQIVAQIDADEETDEISLYELQYLIFKKANKADQAIKAEKMVQKAVKRYRLPWQRFAENLARQLNGEDVLPLVAEG